MSALTCIGPRSRSISFIAVKSGRSGQPVHRPEGRAGTAPASAAAGNSGCSRTDRAAWPAGLVSRRPQRLRAVALDERPRVP